MDKQELRQDPIREKILSSLSYIENNKSALAIIVGVFVLVIVASGYYSSTSKALATDTSIKFGKAINNSIAGNDDVANLAFSEIMNSNSRSGAANSLISMIEYNLKEGNEFAVDSLLNIDISVKDGYLESKLLSIRGDRAFDRMEYEEALNYYKLAGKTDTTMESALKLKEVSVHIEMGDSDRAMEVLIKMLEDDSLPFDIKNRCNSYLSMLKNKA